MNIHMKTCSLCSCWVRVWRRRHIHAGFRWFYHREEVSKKSATGTRLAERWHFEETLTALRRTRQRTKRERNNYRDSKRRLPLKSFFFFWQFGARPLPSTVETIRLNNPLRCGKEGTLEEPHPWNVISEFPMWPFREGKTQRSSGFGIFVTRPCCERRM